MARETRVWHPEGSYREGERVNHKGVAYEARMDCPRGFAPDGKGNGFVWKKALFVPEVKAIYERQRQAEMQRRAPAPQSQHSPAPVGKTAAGRPRYHTRDMAALVKTDRD